MLRKRMRRMSISVNGTGMQRFFAHHLGNFFILFAKSVKVTFNSRPLVSPNNAHPFLPSKITLFIASHNKSLLYFFGTYGVRLSLQQLRDEFANLACFQLQFYPQIEGLRPQKQLFSNFRALQQFVFCKTMKHFICVHLYHLFFARQIMLEPHSRTWHK